MARESGRLPGERGAGPEVLERPSSPVAVADPPAGSPDPETRRDRRRRVVVWTARVLICAAVVLGWIGLSRDGTWNLVVGSPLGALGVIGDWLGSGAWWSDLGVTLQEAVLGFLLGLLLAVVLVATIVPVPWLAKFVAPFVAAANALPKIVLAPLFILWFGISLPSKTYFVAASIFFILFYGIYSGVQTIDRRLIDNARMLGASRLGLIGHVYAPATLSWVVSGIRLSWSWALLAAVVAEYLGANKGLGSRIATAQQLVQVNAVIAGIVVVAVIAVAFDRTLVLVERRFSAWRVF